MRAEAGNQQGQTKVQRLQVSTCFQSWVILLSQECFVKGSLDVSVSYRPCLVSEKEMLKFFFPN